MITKFSLSFLFLMSGHNILAQTSKDSVKKNPTADTTTFTFLPNLFHLELGGNGFFISWNYERYLTPNLGVRIGVGSVGYSQTSTETKSQFPTQPTLLLMLNYLAFGKLELGLGENTLLSPKYRCRITLFDFPNNCPLVWLTSRVGYRILPRNGGFTFAIAYANHINISPLAVQNFYGLSFGYSF